MIIRNWLKTNVWWGESDQVQSMAMRKRSNPKYGDQNK
jgi:hypothetical protein